MASKTEYQESLDWLFSQLPMFSRIGAAAYKPGLETTQRLDELFGHPHKKFNSIHVGGTNGKGSTSHLLASVLQSHGFKTGLYTSPHLTDFRERMRINGEMIPQENVVEFVRKWKEKKTGLRPSFFELTMMMAFDWFARENVDYAIIEVGMGGRLDSTNIITPILSVITNISFDHTQFLGHTLPQIASEKAGIIKKGIPTVIGEATEETKDVFIAKAEEMGAPILFASEKKGLPELKRDAEGGWICNTAEGESIHFPLGGEYQVKNLRTLFTALRALAQNGFELDPLKIKEGIENVVETTGLRGRWQIVGLQPIVVCDTGHNHAGISENLATLQSRFPGREIRFVLGFVNDKDVSEIVKLFPSEAASYYFTNASIPRALPAQEVAEIFAARGIEGEVIADVKEAVARAIADAGKDDVVYVGGSTFVVADYMKK